MAAPKKQPVAPPAPPQAQDETPAPAAVVEAQATPAAASPTPTEGAAGGDAAPAAPARQAPTVEEAVTDFLKTSGEGMYRILGPCMHHGLAVGAIVARDMFCPNAPFKTEDARDQAIAAVIERLIALGRITLEL